MGNYAKAIHNIQKQLMKLTLESLGVNPNYSQEEVEEGFQVLAVNCYLACPELELTLGIPPHSDYGSITILHQSCIGLQLLKSQLWFLQYEEKYKCCATKPKTKHTKH